MKTKQNIANQNNGVERLPSSLETLKHEVQGFKVPDGYFDSLGSRIGDAIIKQENRSFYKALVPKLQKPLVWAPLTATAVVAVLLLFLIPTKNEKAIQVDNEWMEVNMAYDASYAEEALFAESSLLETEISNAGISNIEFASNTTANELSDYEITEYLKTQEIDSDILITD